MARGDLAGEVNSFGTYLEAVRNLREQGRVDVVAPDQITPYSLKSTSQPRPRPILKYLASSKSPQSLAELMETTKMRFTDFTRTIEFLNNTNMITISEAGGDEEVQITPLGREFLMSE
ncbi:MAG TPA: hypothetical protein VF826_03830 [Chloroflexia bacterium]|jgi:hypothetical protein